MLPLLALTILNTMERFLLPDLSWGPTLYDEGWWFWALLVPIVLALITALIIQFAGCSEGGCCRKRVVDGGMTATTKRVRSNHDRSWFSFCNGNNVTTGVIQQPLE
jgi:hypothetical protein